MKTFKSLKLFVLVCCLAMLLTGCSSAKKQSNKGIEEQPDPKATRVIMLDIGQGDSLLIQANGKNILVDASKIDTRKDLVAKLNKYNVKELDLVVSTHPHEDHIGGMDAVFDNFKVKEVYDPAMPSTSKLFQNYLKKIQAKKIKFTVPKAGNKVELGPTTYLEFFTPLAQPFDNNPNNVSLVFKLVDSKFTMLFTGDVERPVEEILVQKYGDKLKSDVLKSPHHASRTSSSLQFLKAVQAKDVLISCAEGNEYKHPHEPVIKRYENAKMNIYVTYKTGDMAVTGSEQGYRIITTK